MTARRLITLGFILVMALLAASGCSFSKKSSSNATAYDPLVKAKTDLAAALLMEGAYAKALPELLAAQKIDSRNADVENYLGLAYYGMKEYSLATESYQKALKLNPKRTDAHNNLGMVYLAQQNYDQALAEFNTCLKDLTYQKMQFPLSNIGLTYFEMRRYDEAMTALKKSTEVAPDYAKSYQLIGRVHLAKGEDLESVDYLTNAAKLDPNDPETFMALGDALAKMNRKEDAAEAYSRASFLVPNSPLALEAQKRARIIMGF